MDLVRLVYDYTDIEIIWLTMKEAPDSWSSILQAQFCKTVVQFQNAVKYHKLTLLNVTPQAWLSTTPAYLGDSSDKPLTTDNALDSTQPAYAYDSGAS